MKLHTDSFHSMCVCVYLCTIYRLWKRSSSMSVHTQPTRTCCRDLGNRDSCQSSLLLAHWAKWQRGWTGAVCIGLSVYKTSTGLHLLCHVGDRCVPPADFACTCSRTFLQLFGKRWNFTLHWNRCQNRHLWRIKDGGKIWLVVFFFSGFQCDLICTDNS